MPVFPIRSTTTHASTETATPLASAGETRVRTRTRVLRHPVTGRASSDLLARPSRPR
jgi:hypothetical protein